MEMSLTPAALAVFWQNDLRFHGLVVVKNREVEELVQSQDQSQKMEISVGSSTRGRGR